MKQAEQFSSPSSDAAPVKPSFRSWMRRFIGGKPESLKAALQEAIDEHEEQAQAPMPPEEKVMITNVLNFRGTKTSDIMIPRADIAAVKYDIGLDELKDYLAEQRHTRIPVYQDTLDKMQGFLHVKDLLPMLAGDRPFSIRSVMRELLFVPPSMRLFDLLVKMRHAGVHMAIVVDEYGGTDGLLTLEDVFEEIVGEIQDEHDESDSPGDLQRLSEHIYDADARIRIESLEKQLSVSLAPQEKKAEFETLGGLIFFQIGRVPPRGEIVVHPAGLRFEIMDADQRSIRRVRIHTD